MSTVSVVLPIIRITPQFPLVLKSIFSQSHPPDHLYIVIQSEDTTLKSDIEFLISHCTVSCDVTLITTSLKGLVFAKYLAISYITSTYTLFAEDDLIFGFDYIECCLDAFLLIQSSRVVQVFCLQQIPCCL